MLCSNTRSESDLPQGVSANLSCRVPKADTWYSLSINCEFPFWFNKFEPWKNIENWLDNRCCQCFTLKFGVRTSWMQQRQNCKFRFKTTEVFYLEPWFMMVQRLTSQSEFEPPNSKSGLASRSNMDKFELPFQKSQSIELEQWNWMQSVEILTWSHCFQARIRQHWWILKCWLIPFGSEFAYERSESQNRQMKNTKIINEMHNLRSFSSIWKYRWPEQMQQSVPFSVIFRRRRLQRPI
jgi:hypothetical protein